MIYGYQGLAEGVKFVAKHGGTSLSRSLEKESEDEAVKFPAIGMTMIYGYQGLAGAVKFVAKHGGTSLSRSL